jgi:hypothetical protein
MSLTGSGYYSWCVKSAEFCMAAPARMNLPGICIGIWFLPDRSIVVAIVGMIRKKNPQRILI